MLAIPLSVITNMIYQPGGQVWSSSDARGVARLMGGAYVVYRALIRTYSSVRSQVQNSA